MKLTCVKKWRRVVKKGKINKNLKDKKQIWKNNSYIYHRVNNFIYKQLFLKSRKIPRKVDKVHKQYNSQNKKNKCTASMINIFDLTFNKKHDKNNETLFLASGKKY